MIPGGRPQLPPDPSIMGAEPVAMTPTQEALLQAFRNEIAKVDRAFLRFIPKPPETLLPRAKTPVLRFGRIKKR